jgi:membrane associated rhomboid family serine protease
MKSMRKQSYFEDHLRNAIPPAIFVVALMWIVYWADFLFLYDFHKLGVLPKSISGLKGILFMPWIHAHQDFKHILNNSVPTFLLLTLLFYSYKDVALKVFLMSWFLTGALLWIFAENKGSFHIGMSGVIYSLTAFLFTSGVLRKFLPLQALSLFIVFIYGSLIWGIFPTSARISWEGHFMGMCVGIVLAFVYRQEGPQRPKYQYEIEKELGIEPPDLEGMYLERLRQAKESEEMRLMEIEAQKQQEASAGNEVKVVYHYVKKENQTNKEDSEPKQ